MLFVISIVPFLSAVAIAYLYVSGFCMAIGLISGGRLFQALMLLGIGMKTCMRQSWLEGWCTIQCVESVRQAQACGGSVCP